MYVLIVFILQCQKDQTAAKLFKKIRETIVF